MYFLHWMDKLFKLHVYGIPVMSKLWYNTDINRLDICILFFSFLFLLYIYWPWSYGIWIYNYLCNQFLSPLMLWVCQCLSLGTPGSKKTDRHDITEILLKVVLSTIKPTNQPTNQPASHPLNDVLINYFFTMCIILASKIIWIPVNMFRTIQLRNHKYISYSNWQLKLVLLSQA